MRKHISIITAQMNMRDVILETSKSMHELLCFSDVVYIDGHFMAYHGMSNTLYGYNPQKRLAMHGREYFFVHDRNGLPVYATISDGYRKSKHYMEDVDKKLRYIYGVKKKELLEVFERIQENGILRLSDEKKLFFDWLKMNAIWAKREIVEIVKPLYKGLRDVNKFVKSILRSRTYVRKEDEVLYVSFLPQRSKKVPGHWNNYVLLLMNMEISTWA